MRKRVNTRERSDREGIGRERAYSARRAHRGACAADGGEAERDSGGSHAGARDLPSDYYSLARPGNLFMHQTQEREMLQLLDRLGFLP